MDGCPSDPKKIIMKCHVNWGHASARQLMKVLLDSDGDNIHLGNYVAEALANRDGCRAFDKAPNVPTAGMYAVSMFDEKLLADSLFLGDSTALHSMDVN